MSDLENSLKGCKNKNFGYYFGKDKKCYYIYHTKFGRERNIEINESNDINSKFEALTSNIYEENLRVFNELQLAFKNYLNIYGDEDTIHIKFKKDGNFLKTKKAIVDNFEQTLEEDSNQNKFDKEK
ncbi:hypothetical protein CK602_08225, partial [Campylobacter coli]|nr:hypothetical protein [Campylobacter coli]